MNKGDRIKWQYTHHLNSKSTTQRVKKGVYVRQVKDGEFNWTIYALVHFDGNKNPSRVRMDELRYECPKKEFRESGPDKINLGK